MYDVLAESSGLGRVVRCGDCADIHLTCGGVSLRLTPEAFGGLLAMMKRAARKMAQEEAGVESFSVSFNDGRPVFKPLA